MSIRIISPQRVYVFDQSDLLDVPLFKNMSSDVGHLPDELQLTIDAYPLHWYFNKKSKKISKVINHPDITFFCYDKLYRRICMHLSYDIEYLSLKYEIRRAWLMYHGVSRLVDILEIILRPCLEKIETIMSSEMKLLEPYELDEVLAKFDNKESKEYIIESDVYKFLSVEKLPQGQYYFQYLFTTDSKYINIEAKPNRWEIVEQFNFFEKQESIVIKTPTHYVHYQNNGKIMITCYDIQGQVVGKCVGKLKKDYTSIIHYLNEDGTKIAWEDSKYKDDINLILKELEL